MNPYIYVECIDCGNTHEFSPDVPKCSRCGGRWFFARYDYKKVRPIWEKNLKKRPFNLWRYHELLPISELYPTISMGEGGTPLIHAQNLGMMLGLKNLYIKDERQNPTSSFKDRQAAVTIAALKEENILEAVLASTGNVAIAYSAYAARAGIKLWAFLTSMVPSEKMREVAIYGTQVIKVTASYDQTKQVAAEFATQRQHGAYLERGVQSIPALESMKTIAFEIAEQLGDRLRTQDNTEGLNMIAPDWYIQALSGGLGAVGVNKGFSELLEMGLVEKTPAIVGVQSEGCAPMVQAWAEDKDQATPVTQPHTQIATLATGDPGRTYTLLYKTMKERGAGTFVSVSDDDAFRAMHIMAKMEGISMEPASAVAFAGLFKLVRDGIVKPDDLIVVNLTGHTLPIEKSILGEGWSRDIEVPQQEYEKSPEEGLLAALSRISPQRYPRIAIVDDHPDARRLIRRILQSQGEYVIFEATNGREAIELAKAELPDLIILDLMMPEVDGFSVLDALKNDPNTESISVIVVTAKELTSEEKRKLHGRIDALMQKGQFMNDELYDEIKSIVTE